MSEAVLLALAIATIAFLYASVGHAGASGYIAVLSLAGFAATEIRPTALLLNILVALLGTVQFVRAGHFRWSLFWRFALLSAPAAFAAGSLRVPLRILTPLIGIVLLFSAARLLVRRRDPAVVVAPGTGMSIAAGAGLGFLAGLTGTGGGIFLTPLLLLCRWATTKTAAAVSVVFILVNSAAGLAGYAWSGQPFPRVGWLLAGAAAAGGGLGSYLGSHRLPVPAIRALLAVVLTIAGVKLLAAAFQG